MESLKDYIAVVTAILVGVTALVEALNYAIEKSSLMANNIRQLFKYGLKKR